MPIKLEQYQEQAVQWLSRTRRGLVHAPAGSGKTIIAAAAIRRVLEARRRTERVPVGWICNTVEQRSQALAAAAAVGLNDLPVDLTVRCAMSGADWSRCAALVVDECHHATAPVWRSQLETCGGCVWGFSATPETGDPERDSQLLDLFGGNIHRVDRSCVGSRLVAAQVRMLDASDPDAADRIDAAIKRLMPVRLRQFARSNLDAGQIRSMVIWESCCQEGISGNELRNLAALEAAEQHRGQKVLMLVNNVEHAERMAGRLGDGVMACMSRIGKKRRREALERFGTGDIWCLVATSLADEGLDVPAASCLVLVSGGKSAVKAEQRTGRVLRAFAGKTEGMIYDFSDTFHRTMQRHSQLRLALYRELGYQIEWDLK